MSHGGRRAGAGRPAGSGWRPAVTEMRVAAAEKMVEIVGSERDPLDIAIGIASDESLDVQTRLGACAICIPFLYPRLSATQVASNVTVTKVDGAELLARLEDRLAKLQTPMPAPAVTIEVAPE